MVNMTLAIPESLHKVMKKHSEVKWTEVARKALAKKASEVEMAKDPLRYYSLKRLAEGSDDAEDLIEF